MFVRNSFFGAILGRCNDTQPPAPMPPPPYPPAPPPAPPPLVPMPPSPPSYQVMPPSASDHGAERSCDNVANAVIDAYWDGYSLACPCPYTCHTLQTSPNKDLLFLMCMCTGPPRPPFLPPYPPAPTLPNPSTPSTPNSPPPPRPPKASPFVELTFYSPSRQFIQAAECTTLIISTFPYFTGRAST